MPMYWTFNWFLGCWYISLPSPKWLSNLEFWRPKKRTNLPELGSGGEFRWFGQCPKENVFFHWCLPLIHLFSFNRKLNFNIFGQLLHMLPHVMYPLKGLTWNVWNGQNSRIKINNGCWIFFRHQATKMCLNFELNEFWNFWFRNGSLWYSLLMLLQITLLYILKCE